MSASPSSTKLKETLLRNTAVCSELVRNESDGALRCVACAHRCFIPRGRDGICKVRSNIDGALHVPWGYVAALQADPIEKKPFFHAFPGSKALSFGMLGCDLHCAYCQNWITSQALRDPLASGRLQRMTPEAIVELARTTHAKVLASTYNEPLITSEWAVEIFKLAKAEGLVNAYISNGNATPEVLEYIRPYVDLYKIDLKSFDDKQYRKMGTVLTQVLDSIRQVYEMGFWLEIVTLLVPGLNDSDDEIKKMCDFLVAISPDIPWHANAFYSNYKMSSVAATSTDTLLRAEAIARASGLRYVYLGNRPGQVGAFENTRCPGCTTELIRRRGIHLGESLLKDGACFRCGTKIPGRWV